MEPGFLQWVVGSHCEFGFPPAYELPGASAARDLDDLTDYAGAQLPSSFSQDLTVYAEAGFPQRSVRIVAGASIDLTTYAEAGFPQCSVRTLPFTRKQASLNVQSVVARASIDLTTYAEAGFPQCSVWTLPFTRKQASLNVQSVAT